MTFVERNKRWLLPILAVAAAGVVWLNFPAQSVEASTDASEKIPVLTTEAPAPAAPQPAPALDQDFKYLETPPPGANDPAPLMEEGRWILDDGRRSPARPPELHPRLWSRLPGLPAPPRSPGPARAPAAKLPGALEFVIETGSGREVWIDGVGYRAGATLAGGYRIKRITGTGVVLTGPSGDVERPLRAEP